MTILCWLFKNRELVGPESQRIGEDVGIPDADEQNNIFAQELGSTAKSRHAF
jgi:hypothetical protein